MLRVWQLYYSSNWQSVLYWDYGHDAVWPQTLHKAQLWRVSCLFSTVKQGLDCFQVGHIHPFILLRVAEGWRLSQHALGEAGNTWAGLTHTSTSHISWHASLCCGRKPATEGGDDRAQEAPVSWFKPGTDEPVRTDPHRHPSCWRIICSVSEIFACFKSFISVAAVSHEMCRHWTFYSSTC